jgi:hypothetical protein
MLSVRPLSTAPIAVSPAVLEARTAYLAAVEAGQDVFAAEAAAIVAASMAATEIGQDEFYALVTGYYILGRVKNPTTTSATRKLRTISGTNLFTTTKASKKYDTVGD